MNEIILHAHPDVGWVSWRIGRSGFSRIHLERPGSTHTLCDVGVPVIGRVVRDQFSAPLEYICTNCLREYARGAKPPLNAA